MTGWHTISVEQLLWTVGPVDTEILLKILDIERAMLNDRGYGLCLSLSVGSVWRVDKMLF